MLCLSGFKLYSSWVPLKFPYKTHGKRFIVYCRVMDALRRLRIAKLLTSSACSIMKHARAIEFD